MENNNLGNLVTYDNDGVIILCQAGPDDSLLSSQAMMPDMNTLFHKEGLVTNEHYFVDTTTHEVKAKGEKPGEGYVFDYLTSQWTFDLTVSKEEKWLEIKKERDYQEFNSFEWQGNQVQCNEESQRRIQGAVQMAVIDASLVIDWTMEDNSVVSLTAAQVIDMGTALGNHITTTHERGRALRQLIADATTEAQLALIAW